MKKIIFGLLLLPAIAAADITSIATFPAGQNKAVQFNQAGRFGADSTLTFSTSTKVFSAQIISATSTIFNGNSYTWPATICAGGTVLTMNGAGGINCVAPSTLVVSTGVALGTWDGSVQISTAVSDVIYSPTQFIISLQGSTSVQVALDPALVTLLGPTIDLASGEAVGNLAPSRIAAGALPSTVIASSIAVASVLDASIVSVAGSKVSGNIPGNSAGITGTVNGNQVVGFGAFNASGQVPYTTGSFSMVSSTGMLWDSTNWRLTVDGTSVAAGPHLYVRGGQNNFKQIIAEFQNQGTSGGTTESQYLFSQGSTPGQFEQGSFQFLDAGGSGEQFSLWLTPNGLIASRQQVLRVIGTYPPKYYFGTNNVGTAYFDFLQNNSTFASDPTVVMRVSSVNGNGVGDILRLYAHDNSSLRFKVTDAGLVNVPGLTISQPVCTDGSGNLSSCSSGITVSSYGVVYGNASNNVATDTSTLRYDFVNKDMILDAALPVIVASSSTPNMNLAGFTIVHKGFLYSTSPTAHSLTVFDVTNPLAPKLVKQIIGSFGVPPYATEGLEASGNYLYMLNFGNPNGGNMLTVYDISNGGNPVQVANLTDATNLAQCEHIRIYGNYAYIANYAAAYPTKPGLTVVDISNPFNPVVVGSNTNVGQTNPIYIQIQYPYLYMTNETFGSGKVQVYDITNPILPVLTYSATPAGLTGSGSPLGHDIKGRYWYILDNGDGKMFTYDISIASSPVQVSTLTFTGETGMITPLIAANNLYASSPNGVWKVSLADPANPTLVGRLNGGTSMFSPDDIESAGQYLYVSDHGSGGNFSGFTVLDIGSQVTGGVRAGTGEFEQLRVSHDLRVNRLFVDGSMAATSIGSQHQIYGQYFTAGSSVTISTFPLVNTSTITVSKDLTLSYGTVGQLLRLDGNKIVVSTASVLATEVIGTFQPSVLPSTIAYTTAANNFTAPQTFQSSVTVNNSVRISSDVYASTGSAIGFDAYQLSTYVDKSTVTWNNGNIQVSNLTANVTYVFNPPAHSLTTTLVIKTGAGSFTATWPANVKWSAGAAPTITVTASKVDIVSCKYIIADDKYYCAWIGNY